MQLLGVQLELSLLELVQSFLKLIGHGSARHLSFLTVRRFLNTLAGAVH